MMMVVCVCMIIYLRAQIRQWTTITSLRGNGQRSEAQPFMYFILKTHDMRVYCLPGMCALLTISITIFAELHQQSNRYMVQCQHEL